MFVKRLKASLIMALKRTFDIFASTFGLVVSFPFLSIVGFFVWLYDRKCPIYIADRVGINGTIFKMYKLRSMVINADRSGVDSTSSDDLRITPVGHIIRKLKLDELTQLINVFLGDMSLVGPRPNVKSETDRYTLTEKRLLRVRPGITDFSSIIFSDEGDILKGSSDPDLDYNQLIRPWKSRLGLFYLEHQSFFLDILLILFTILSAFSKKSSLNMISSVLSRFGADESVINVASRKFILTPYPPPGSNKVVS